MWNKDGNFDRVSALGMLMWHDATMQAVTIKRTKEVKGFLEDPYFEKMGVLRKNNDPRNWKNPLLNN